jgi:hypothetical protein
MSNAWSINDNLNWNLYPCRVAYPVRFPLPLFKKPYMTIIKLFQLAISDSDFICTLIRILFRVEARRGLISACIVNCQLDQWMESTDRPLIEPFAFQKTADKFLMYWFTTSVGCVFNLHFPLHFVIARHFNSYRKAFLELFLQFQAPVMCGQLGKQIQFNSLKLKMQVSTYKVSANNFPPLFLTLVLGNSTRGLQILADPATH